MKRSEGLKRISFLAHSLGGLISRYAVAVLYTPSVSCGDRFDDAQRHPSRGLIAGLEPISFITLATPHLGVRGRKQVCFDQNNSLLIKIII